MMRQIAEPRPHVIMLQVGGNDVSTTESNGVLIANRLITPAQDLQNYADPEYIYICGPTYHERSQHMPTRAARVHYNQQVERLARGQHSTSGQATTQRVWPGDNTACLARRQHSASGQGTTQRVWPGDNTAHLARGQHSTSGQGTTQRVWPGDNTARLARGQHSASGQGTTQSQVLETQGIQKSNKPSDHDGTHLNILGLIKYRLSIRGTILHAQNNFSNI